jgi:hypothetical protein
MPRVTGPRVHKHTVMNKPRERGVRVPVLLISGNWLAAAGFSIGAKYTALSEEEGRIILTVHESAPAARERVGRK